MWEPLSQFIKLLNSQQAPHQLSLGICFAMLVGLTPTLSLHNLLVLFFIFILRVNISAFLLSWALFSLLGLFMDPLFHSLGQWMLQQPELQELWTGMYNNSFWRLTRFNNTIVLGSLSISLLAFVPLFVLSNRLIMFYRERLQAACLKFYERHTRLFKAGKFTSMFIRQR